MASAHAKRRARTRQRLEFLGTAMHTRELIVAAAIESLPSGHALKRFQDAPGLGWLMPSDLPPSEWEELQAAIRTLSPKRVQQIVQSPPPSYAPSATELKAVLDATLIGQRRAAGRPPKPENSNDRVVALLREQRHTDLVGRFTLRRADETKRWLERRGIYKSADAITKLVNRAKKPAK